jgi:hypothetical protein
VSTDEQKSQRDQQGSDGQEGQVSDAGGALNDDETAVAGADAVPDKTSGSGGSDAD